MRCGPITNARRQRAALVRYRRLHDAGGIPAGTGRRAGALLTACRAFLPDFDGLSREEAIAVSAVIEIAEIIGAIPPQPRTLPEEPLPED
jgi:hypothetical protein